MLSQQLASETSQRLEQNGAREYPESRGESAYVFEIAGLRLAFVLECLGTKSLIAQEYWRTEGKNYFANIGYDTVAAIVNDIIAVGARPAVLNAYFAAGGSEFLAEDELFSSLIAGWKRGCDDAGATWAGGETPSLPGLIADGSIEVAGSCVGYFPSERNPMFGAELAPGDSIVLISSSGLHSNGASLARMIAKELPQGMASVLPSGRTLRESLLAPSLIYVGFLDQLFLRGEPITYVSHITGHGLRKIMRARSEVSYRITRLPSVPEELAYLVEAGNLDMHSAYGTFNMGAGLAIFCRGRATDIVKDANSMGFLAIEAGYVEEGPKQVVIEPLGLTYEGRELPIRL